MKRIGRWMLNGLTVLSLVLFLATCALWGRSYFASDFFEYVRAERSLTVVGIDKTLMLVFFKASSLLPFQGWTYSPNPADPGYTAKYFPTIWGRFGFIFTYAENHDNSGFSSTRIIGAPLWLITALLGALPFSRAIAWLRRAGSRSKCGLCPFCRSNFTGNVGGVCPECGTKVEAICA